MQTSDASRQLPRFIDLSLYSHTNHTKLVLEGLQLGFMTFKVPCIMSKIWSLIRYGELQVLQRQFHRHLSMAVNLGKIYGKDRCFYPRDSFSSTFDYHRTIRLARIRLSVSPCCDHRTKSAIVNRVNGIETTHKTQKYGETSSVFELFSR